MHNLNKRVREERNKTSPIVQILVSIQLEKIFTKINVSDVSCWLYVIFKIFQYRLGPFLSVYRIEFTLVQFQLAEGIKINCQELIISE